MKINNKLLCWFLSVALLPLGCFAYLGYRHSKNTVTQVTTKNLIFTANYKVDQIKKYIHGKEGSVDILAKMPFLINSIEEFNMVFENAGIASPEYVAVDEKYRPIFERYIERAGYNDALLISTEGNVVFSVNKEEDLGSNLETGIYKNSQLALAFEQAKTLLVTSISDFEYYPASNYPAAFISTPVVKEGQLIGVFACQFDNNEIYSLLQDYSGLGETGEIVAAVRIGNQALVMAPLRYNPYAAFRRKIDIGSRIGFPIQEAVQGKKGSGIFFDYQGKRVLAAWQYLPDLRWGVVVKIDTKEVFAEVTKLEKWYLFAGFIVISFVMAAAIFVSKGIASPIVRLQKVAAEIGKGKLDTEIAVSSSDEIGDLTRSFKRMIEDLRETTVSRDSLIKEITERKEVEEEREKILRWQQNVNKLQQSLLVSATLVGKLKSITDIIVRIFDADFCRIWLIRPGDLCGQGCIHAEARKGPHVCSLRQKCLHLISSSGRYTHIDGKGHARVPFGCYKIGRIASGEEHKFLTNDVVSDPLVHNHEWARELGLVSFAGYQLRIPGGETIGVLALFAKHPILSAEDAALDNLSITTAFVVQQADMEDNLGLQAQELEASLKEALKSREILSSMLEDNNKTREELENKLEELKQAQNMLIQSEKLASLGKLVSDMAHEVNNPLMIISGNAQLSLLDETLNEELKNNLKIIHEECNRAKSIIQRLLVFSRPSKGEQKALDINHSIESVVKLLAHQYSLSNVKISMQFSEGLPLLMADEKQLQEVFMNLFNNARDAMPEGGEIAVNSSLDGEYCKIEVKDSGAGMDDKTLAKVFEPFFTTKEKGTGLGLSVCFGIIKAHKGKIEFKSQLQKGTTAHIWLPIKAEGV